MSKSGLKNDNLVWNNMFLYLFQKIYGSRYFDTKSIKLASSESYVFQRVTVDLSKSYVFQTNVEGLMALSYINMKVCQRSKLERQIYLQPWPQFKVMKARPSFKGLYYEWYISSKEKCQTSSLEDCIFFSTYLYIY